MTIDTRFPFYDHVLGLLTPFLPMIVNDMSSQIIDWDVDEPEDDEVYADTVYETEMDGEFADEGDIDYLNIAISFERGFFPDSQVEDAFDESQECDYEVIIKPFFTIKPYILFGLHNNKTKQFFAEVTEFNDFHPIEILERFALLIHALFKDESLYNKIFIMTSMAHLSIRELIAFDEPTYIKGKSGDIQYVSSPYFELDNPSIHEFLIKQKHYN
ncbi:hypothetical protein DRW41_13685 [Neobacillus piezotolerans]|uniref:Uncharacterized protein n=1 Tax=Neobacillus piezotolerans TaxID=2259171 RepID=A0A3D8GQV9_9BACI|nr:hypothetical protein [Neobacillus piezotolerans]RDU36569.1 hypothetical protein DRW41_13685 [Neobacillus piezotolerans]